MKTTEKIFNAIKGENINIMFSWGAHNFVTDNNILLAFNVNGRLFSGQVGVVFDEEHDSCFVQFYNKTTGDSELHQDVKLQDLQSFLDKRIEIGDMTEDEYKNFVNDVVPGCLKHAKNIVFV